MTAEEYRQLRKVAGLSQQALAERLGIATQSVKDREAGRYKVSPEAAIALRAVVADVETEKRAAMPRPLREPSHSECLVMLRRQRTD